MSYVIVASNSTFTNTTISIIFLAKIRAMRLSRVHDRAPGGQALPVGETATCSSVAWKMRKRSSGWVGLRQGGMLALSGKKAARGTEEWGGELDKSMRPGEAGRGKEKEKEMVLFACRFRTCLPSEMLARSLLVFIVNLCAHTHTHACQVWLVVLCCFTRL